MFGKSNSSLDVNNSNTAKYKGFLGKVPLRLYLWEKKWQIESETN